ncbi:CHX17 [Scenedesmus sp. PABB004]|nr:CHX17 [Scenedesmus sp. PABB004]
MNLLNLLDTVERTVTEAAAAVVESASEHKGAAAAARAPPQHALLLQSTAGAASATRAAEASWESVDWQARWQRASSQAAAAHSAHPAAHPAHPAAPRRAQDQQARAAAALEALRGGAAPPADEVAAVYELLVSLPDPLPALSSAAALAARSAELEASSRDLAAQVARLEADQAEVTALVAEHQALQAAHAALQAAAAASQEAAASAQAGSGAAARLEQEVREQAETIGGLQLALETLRGDLEASQSALFELQEQRAAAAGGASTAEALAVEEAERLAAELAQLRRERDQLQRQLEQQQREQSQQQEQQSQAEGAAAQGGDGGGSQHGRQEAALAALQAQLDAAQEATCEQQHQAAMLDAKLTAAEGRAERLTAELARRPAASAVAEMTEQLAALSALVGQQLVVEGWAEEQAAAAVLAAAKPGELELLLQVGAAGQPGAPAGSCLASRCRGPAGLAPAERPPAGWRGAQERCRKLEVAASASKAEAAAASAAVRAAEEAAGELQAQLEASQQLVLQLEADVLAMSAGAAAAGQGAAAGRPGAQQEPPGAAASSAAGGAAGSLGGALEPQGLDAELHRLVSLGGAGSEPGTAAAAAGADAERPAADALLAAVTAQRDRFRARLGQLEGEAGGLQAELKAARDRAAALERDNVALVEKLRFTERYKQQGGAGGGAGGGGSAGTVTVVRVDGAGVVVPGDASVYGAAAPGADRKAGRYRCGPLSLELGSGGAGGQRTSARAPPGGPESRYVDEYEARLNPFAEFQHSEAEARLRGLRMHDKVLLAGGRLLAGSCAARAGVAAYAVLLHAFVLFLLQRAAAPHAACAGGAGGGAAASAAAAGSALAAARLAAGERAVRAAMAAPYSVSLDADAARALATHGASILLLDVPLGMPLGIDQQVFLTGPKFRGVKMMPPGVHFLSFQTQGRDGAVAPPVSTLLALAPRQVLVRRWCAAAETFLPLADEDEVRERRLAARRERQLTDGPAAAAAAARAADAGARGLHLQEARFAAGVARFDFDSGLAPYDLARYGQWAALSRHVTPRLLRLLLPEDGEISIMAEATDPQLMAPASAAERRLQQQLQEGRARMQAAMQIERPEQPGEQQEQQQQEQQPDPQQQQEPSRAPRGGRCRYTPLPRLLKVPGASAQQLTAMNLDKTSLLEQVIARYAGDGGERQGEQQQGEQSQPAAAAQRAAPPPRGVEVVGELQFAFIAFVFGQSLEGFMQWKQLLVLLLGCSSGPLHTHSALFVEALAALTAQLQLGLGLGGGGDAGGGGGTGCEALLGNGLVDELLPDSFLRGAFRGFFELLHESGDAPAALLAQARVLERVLASGLGWDFRLAALRLGSDDGSDDGNRQLRSDAQPRGAAKPDRPGPGAPTRQGRRQRPPDPPGPRRRPRSPSDPAPRDSEPPRRRSSAMAAARCLLAALARAGGPAPGAAPVAALGVAGLSPGLAARAFGSSAAPAGGFTGKDAAYNLANTADPEAAAAIKAFQREAFAAAAKGAPKAAGGEPALELSSKVERKYMAAAIVETGIQAVSVPLSHAADGGGAAALKRYVAQLADVGAQAGFAPPAAELDAALEAAGAGAESVKELLARIRPYASPEFHAALVAALVAVEEETGATVTLDGASPGYKKFADKVKALAQAHKLPWQMLLPVKQKLATADEDTADKLRKDYAAWLQAAALADARAEIAELQAEATRLLDSQLAKSADAVRKEQAAALAAIGRKLEAAGGADWAVAYKKDLEFTAWFDAAVAADPKAGPKAAAAPRDLARPERAGDRAAEAPPQSRRRARMAGSAELFESVTSDPLLLFLLQVMLTLALTRLLGKVVSYMKQPLVIGEIIAGIVMGPSVMGRIPGFTATLWPTAMKLPSGALYNSTITFGVVASMGVILFMFLLGCELDQRLLARQWRRSAPIALSAIAFPFAVGAAASLWLQGVNAEVAPPGWTAPSSRAFILFMGAAMSFTAFPVLASLLSSAGLLSAPIGIQALSCAAIDDVLAWCVLAIASSFARSGSALLGLYTTLCAAGYVLAMVCAVRPLLRRVHAGLVARGAEGNRYYLSALFMLLLLSAFTTEGLQIHAFFGAFVFGLVVPKEGGFAESLVTRMDLVVTEVMLPLFFANSGIRTDIGTLSGAAAWGITAAITGIACFAKFTPACLVGKAVTRRPWRFCVALGLLMNTRGLVEIIALNIGLSMGILSPRMFTMMIIMAIATTCMTAPGMHLLYRGREHELTAPDALAGGGDGGAPGLPEVAPAPDAPPGAGGGAADAPVAAKPPAAVAAMAAGRSAALLLAAALACHALACHALKAPPLLFPLAPSGGGWADAAATFDNGYDYIHCPASATVEPASTAEVAAAVAALAARADAGEVVKLRATIRGFGSSASFPCPVSPRAAGNASAGSSSGGGRGGGGVHVVGVLMDRMRRVLEVDTEAMTMRVQANMKLDALYKAATDAGLGVPLGIVPAWAGLTLAGVMAASAHGSGRNTTSVICDVVTEITFVDGLGQVHTVPRASDAGRGLCSGLGLLGIVTELKLQLAAPTHTRVDTWHLRDDAHLARDVARMLALSPRLLVLWRPDIRRYSGYMLTEVPTSVPADAGARCTILPAMAPPLAWLAGTSIKAWQADVNNAIPGLAALTDASMCAAAAAMSVGQPWAVGGDGKPMLSGVGLTNKIQSVDCGGDCAWTSVHANTTIQDVELTIEHALLGEWIDDVKRIFAHDLPPGPLGTPRCLPPGFMVMRFGRPSDDLLSTTGGLSDPVYVQQITMRAKMPKMARQAPSKFEFVQEIVEQLTLTKYDGRPHWGKCFDRTFTHPDAPLARKFGAERWGAMLDLQRRFDPARLLEPELFMRAAAPGGAAASAAAPARGPRCTLARTCFCSEDVHCAEGHVCVPARSFPRFRACKPPAFV